MWTVVVHSVFFLQTSYNEFALICRCRNLIMYQTSLSSISPLHTQLTQFPPDFLLHQPIHEMYEWNMLANGRYLQWYTADPTVFMISFIYILSFESLRICSHHENDSFLPPPMWSKGMAKLLSFSNVISFVCVSVANYLFYITGLLALHAIFL